MKESVFLQQIDTVNKAFENVKFDDYDLLEEQVDLWNIADSIIDCLKTSLRIALPKTNKNLNQSFRFLKHLSNKNDELAYKIINFVESSEEYNFINLEDGYLMIV